MYDEIKRVYVGLPVQFVNKVLWVEQAYRTNSLSHQPGGFDVVVEYKSNNVLGYDRVKKPGPYISKVLFKEAVKSGRSEYSRDDETMELSIAKEFVETVYARAYQDDSEYASASFAEVWNSQISDISPTQALNKFEADLDRARITTVIHDTYAKAAAACGSNCHECFKLLDKILKLDHANRAAYVKKLRCVHRLDHSEHLAECFNALKLFPADDEILGITARLLFESRNYAECFKYCNKALKFNPENGDGLFYKAKLFAASPSSEAYPNPRAVALEYFEKYISSCKKEGSKHNPRGAYFSVGNLYQVEGEFRKAKAYFLLALDELEKLIDKNGSSVRYSNLLKSNMEKLDELANW